MTLPNQMLQFESLVNCQWNAICIHSLQTVDNIYSCTVHLVINDTTSKSVNVIYVERDDQSTFNLYDEGGDTICETVHNAHQAFYEAFKYLRA